MLSRVSEEEQSKDQDIEVDDIGRKSISIHDQEMKDASKSSSKGKCDSGANLNSIIKSNSNSEQLKTKPYVQRMINASSGLVRNINDKLHEKVNNRHVTSEDKSKSKLDLKSIQIRQFNLEHCDDGQTQVHDTSKRSQIEEMSVVKRVCLPKFSQNILDQFNLLDIQSSASKSQMVGYEYTTHFSSNDDDKQEGCCNGGATATGQNNNKSQGVGSSQGAVQRGALFNLPFQQMIKVDSPKNHIRCKNKLPLYPRVLRQSQSRQDSNHHGHQITSSTKTKVGGNMASWVQNGSHSLTKMQTNSISKQSHSNHSSNADVLLQTLMN